MIEKNQTQQGETLDQRTQDFALAKSLVRDWLMERGIALTGVNGEVSNSSVNRFKLDLQSRIVDALSNARRAAVAGPRGDARFTPPAEDALHIAICQAVQEHHGPTANAILRSALNDYKPTQLTRTELIRVQQRSGSEEATTVMVSPAATSSPTPAEPANSWIDKLVGAFDDSPTYAEVIENEKRARQWMEEGRCVSCGGLPLASDSARRAAEEIVDELDRRALLYDSHGARSILSGQRERVISAIEPILSKFATTPADNDAESSLEYECDGVHCPPRAHDHKVLL